MNLTEESQANYRQRAAFRTAQVPSLASSPFLSAGVSGHGWRWPAGLAAVALALLLGPGCQRASEAPPPPTNAPTAQPVAQREAELHATVWRNEILAQQHEKSFVKLADDLRRAEDKIRLLSQFAFERILVPARKGTPTKYDLGIQLQRFDDADKLTLPHAAWQQALAQFQAAGWTLAQVEWRHEKFVPASPAQSAWSEFSFELHGEQVTQSNRFILEGVLGVEWLPAAAPGVLPGAGALTVSRLTLLERSGRPGFSNHLLIAPEPDRPAGDVNLHPLMVNDLNGDQHLDIILPGVNKALLNDGQARFEAVPFIQPQNYYSLKDVGVLADFDGDGELDYLGAAEAGPFAKMLVLYRGSGAVPIPTPPVAAWPAQQSDWAHYRFLLASAITAGDVDGDGDLDVFTAQYRQPYLGGQLPTPYYDANDGHPSWLLLNDGHGRFALAPPQPALAAKGHRRTLGASLVDLDLDGDMDLVTLNDFSGVDLFCNDGKAQFTDQTARLGNRHLFGMSHCFADFDRDGQLDFLAIGMSLPAVRRLDFMKLGRSDFPDRTRQRTEMAYGNRLYLARAGLWEQPPFGEQLARTGWSWGTSAFDLENDGDIDVYVANGHVSGESCEDYDNRYWIHDIYLGSSQEDPQLQRYFATALRGLNQGKTSWNGYLHNVLFLDLATNQYRNVAYLMGVAHETDCRAAVSADLNEDGRLDLLVVEARWDGSPNRMRHRLLVHLNQLDTGHHWIGVRFPATANGPAPVGARVLLKTDGSCRVAQVVTGDSFQAQHPFLVHFGLGKSDRVSQLQVVWPGGQSRHLSNPKVDQYHWVDPR